MNFNDIKIFVTVARMKSISRTAEYLGYVQSHISKRIDKLEKEFNCKLFKRTNRGMDLLPEGEKFLNYALKILELMQEVEENFKVNKYNFNLGTTQTISYNYLYELYLDEEINIFIRPIKELIDMYRQHIIDVLIVNRSINSLKIKEVQTYLEKICWVKSSNKEDDIFNKPIAISRDLECPYRRRTMEYLNKYDKEKVRRIVEVDNLNILITMVEKNKAIAILPYKSIKVNNKLKLLNSYELQDIIIYIYYNTTSNKIKDFLMLIEK